MDGKAVWCDEIGLRNQVGYKFIGKKVHQIGYEFDGDRILLRTGFVVGYWTNSDTIFWNMGGFNHQLDRKTLEVFLGLQNKPAMRCRVFDNHSAFDAEGKRLTDIRQREYDKSLKGNKL